MPSVDNSQQNSNQTLHQKYQPPTHVPTSFTWSQDGNHICIAGSFDPPIPTWTPIEMPKNTNNVNEIVLDLLPNKKYYYKFVIDGNWVLDQSLLAHPDASGNYNHEIEVSPPPPPPPSEEVVVEEVVVEEEVVEEVVVEEDAVEEVVVEEKKDEQHHHHYEDEHQVEQVATEGQKEENHQEELEEQREHPQEELEVYHQDEQIAVEEKKEEHHRDEFEEKEHQAEQIAFDGQKVEHHQEELEEKEDLHQEEKVEHHREELEEKEDLHQEEKVEHHREELEEKEDLYQEEKVEHHREELEEKEDLHQEELEEKEDLHQEEKVDHHQEELEEKVDLHQEELEEKEDLHQEEKVEHHREELEEKEEHHREEFEEKVDHHQEELEDKEDHQEEQVAFDEQGLEEKEEHHREEFEEKEEHYHEELEEQKESYQEKFDEYKELQKEQAVEKQEEIKQIVEPILTEESESSVESTKVHSEQLYDDTIAEETSVSALEQQKETEIITNETILKHDDETASASIVKETIIESDNDKLSEIIINETILKHDDETASVSIVGTMIESDNNKLSAGYVANNIEESHDIFKETPSELQYTLSTSHDDSMTTPINVSESLELSFEQSNEETTSSNQDKGISSTTTTQDTDQCKDFEISTATEITYTVPEEKEEKHEEQDFEVGAEVEIEGLSKIKPSEVIINDTKESTTQQNHDHDLAVESVFPQPPTITFPSSPNFYEYNTTVEQSAQVTTEDSVNESKVTEFIEETLSATGEKHEHTVYATSTTETEIPIEHFSAGVSSGSTSDVTSAIVSENEVERVNFVEHADFTETTMPLSEIDYEETYQSELEPIDENEGDGEFTKANIEGSVPVENLEEVILNNTWAKDDLTEEDIPSTWTESSSPALVVWPENFDLEWSDIAEDPLLNLDTVAKKGTTWRKTVSEEAETTDIKVEDRGIEETHTSTEATINLSNESIVKEELQSRESESLLNEIPPLNESIVDTQSIVYSNESQVEHKTREIHVSKESDDEIVKEKLVNKENIPINTKVSTSEVKEKAVADIEEPPSVTTTYNKPESSATAYEKVSILSSLPTSVAAAFASLDIGEQHEESITLKADDVLKVIEKLKLFEKQVNYDESLQPTCTGVNIPCSKTNQNKVISISPNASSPGESTRNVDVYAHNIISSSREPTKETANIKSKHKKPIEITSRELLPRDSKYVKQRDDYKIDFGLVYLFTSLATTFTLGIISMLYKAVFGTKNQRA